MLDSRQLHYFLAICEQGSLAGASDHLRIASSALSHHVTQLEQHLGTPLFRRKPRGMEPTAAGLRLQEHARGIMRAIAAAETDLRDSAGKVSGPVSVGMSFSAVKAIGVPFITRVTQTYPDVQLALTESLSGTQLPHLLAADVDMALVYNPPGNLGIETLPVLEERMVCVGHRDLIGTSDAPITFDELLELPQILLRQGVSARAILDDTTLLKRIESRARLQMNSIQAIAGAIEAGLGCIIGTRLFMHDQLERGQVRARPIVSPELSRRLYLCRMANRPPTYASEALAQELLTQVRRAVTEGRWEAQLLFDG